MAALRHVGFHFRAQFLTHVARELSRWFAAYSHEERTIYSMESD